MQKFRIYGNGGHARVVIDLIEKLGFQVSAIYDDSQSAFSDGTRKPGLYSNSGAFVHKGDQMIVAIGDNKERKNLVERLNSSFGTIIHPSSVLAKTSSIGKGSVVFAGAVIQSYAKIGDHVIINTAASVDHDNVIENFVHISPNATLSGSVTVGEGTHIGSGVVIIPNIKVGKWAILGAGSVIIRDVPDYATVVGNPGRIIKIKGKRMANLDVKEKTRQSSFDREDYSMEVLRLIEEKDRNKYVEINCDTFGKSPFYTPFYFSHHQNMDNDVICFTLKHSEEVMAIMPMVVRKLNKELDPSQNYRDVISPYGYGGPLFKKNFPIEDREIFWRKVDQWYKSNNIVSEFIRFSLNGNYHMYSGNLVGTLENVVGRLDSEFETIWNTFKRKVRNNYRYASKRDIEFKIFESNSITPTVIDNFYNIYIDTMKRLNASELYYFKKSYFEELIKDNIDKYAIALSYWKSIPISTELLVIQENTLFAFLGGSMKEYMALRGNDFLRVEIIKWALQKKDIKNYVLGGGREEWDALYRNKKSFFPNDPDLTFYTGRKIILPKIFKNLTEKRNAQLKESRVTIKDQNYFPQYRSDLD